jgi:hypothetical protein
MVKCFIAIPLSCVKIDPINTIKFVEKLILEVLLFLVHFNFLSNGLLFGDILVVKVNDVGDRGMISVA